MKNPIHDSNPLIVSGNVNRLILLLIRVDKTAAKDSKIKHIPQVNHFNV